jgi:dolichyl-phosphate beta-glucosyltransferase
VNSATRVILSAYHIFLLSARTVHYPRRHAVPDFCLVIPCYNEERRLDVAALERFLAATPGASLCLVNDGSGDGTATLLAEVARRHPDRVLALNLPANAGKAEAVRHGMLRAYAWQRFGYVGYWDADLATPLEESTAMHLLAVSRPEVLLVTGLRLNRLGASVEVTPQRHYPGRLFATLASLVLRLAVYDTQCGAKLMHGSMVPQLLGEPFLSRWIFDVELLARLRNTIGAPAMRRAVVEMPLQTWHGVSGSKMRVAAMLRAPLELAAIARRYN